MLRADGQRIDLSKRDSGALLAATKQEWQSQAWAYRDLIGELREAHRLLAQAVARVRFYPAATRPWPLDPVPLDGDEHDLDKQLAADAVFNFNRLPMDSNPDGFTARFAENLNVAGEAWIHMDADEQFHIRSCSEISGSNDGRIVLNTLPTATAASTRVIDPRTEDLLRCWVPHPQWGHLADSPMRALLDPAEDAVLAGRESRAAARSRVAANGILLMPDTLSMVRVRGDDEDDYDDSVTSDTFMADLTTAMLAPISDDGDAQAVVPIVLRGAQEDLEKVRHLTLQREDSAGLIARQTAALMRLLKGFPVQPEQVDGVGGMNHWGSWSLDARAIREDVQPLAQTVAACLAAAYLRPAMEAVPNSPHDPAQIRRITVGVDLTPLAENPNRGQDARDAHDRFLISDEAGRRELGFDEEDKPSDEEYVRRLATSGRLPVDTTAAVLGLPRTQQERERITVQGETVPAGLPAGQDRPAALPGELHPASTTPAQPTGEQPPGPVVASAAPDDWLVDEVACRRLADIDAAVIERICVAADAALQRVVERAGARVRTAARNDKGLTASIAGLDAHLIPAALGREQVEAFASVTDLIADGYARLHAQLDGWLADAASQAGDATAAVLGLDGRRARVVRDQVVSRLAVHRDRAWPVLAAALDEAAEDALFEPALDPGDLVGEAGDSLIDPLDVVDALAAAGGDTAHAVTAAGGYGGRGRTGKSRRKRREARPASPASPAPAGGVASGPVVQGVIAEHGGVLLAWEWQYRPELLRQTFSPHKQLDGQRFTSWRDPLLATTPQTAWVGSHFRPQDHTGCRCTASPTYAVVADPDSLLAQAIRDAHGDPNSILVGGTPGRGSSASTRNLRDQARAAVDDMRASLLAKPRRRR